MDNQITVTSSISVQKIGEYGGDWLVCDAARVSSKHVAGRGPRELTQADLGLIRALVRQRHTAPFQHGGLTFYVEAPLFVMREWRTHRIGMVQTTDDFAYSEASARYRPLLPKFWVPEAGRPMMLKPNHKPMIPEYLPASQDQENFIRTLLQFGYQDAWNRYQTLLDMGTAPEVARAGLPSAVYSAMYVSCNPRSLMHFLSLRTHEPEAMFVSYPQWEIEVAARELEKLFAENWPATYAAWAQAGRFSG